MVQSASKKFSSPKGDPGSPKGGSVTPQQFINQSIAELKKVVWPTRKKVIRLTVIVLVVSLLTGLFIGGLDYLFTNLMGIIIK